MSLQLLLRDLTDGQTRPMWLVHNLQEERRGTWRQHWHVLAVQTHVYGSHSNHMH
jgi:hypothetical protein